MEFHHVYMRNKREGWIVGGGGVARRTSEHILLHTKDGGFTWKTVLREPGEIFIYVTLVEQEGRPALLIASRRALFQMFLE